MHTETSLVQTFPFITLNKVIKYAIFNGIYFVLLKINMA